MPHGQRDRVGRRRRRARHRRVYVLNTTIRRPIACYVKSTPGRGAYVQDIYGGTSSQNR